LRSAGGGEGFAGDEGGDFAAHGVAGDEPGDVVVGMQGADGVGDGGGHLGEGVAGDGCGVAEAVEVEHDAAETARGEGLGDFGPGAGAATEPMEQEERGCGVAGGVSVDAVGQHAR
jgi:hypothetical protein